MQRARDWQCGPGQQPTRLGPGLSYVLVTNLSLRLVEKAQRGLGQSGSGVNHMLERIALHSQARVHHGLFCLWSLRMLKTTRHGLHLSQFQFNYSSS